MCATRSARAPRPAREPAPPLPPLDALDQTHRQMTEVLADLASLPDHLLAEGPDTTARKRAAAICKFFSETARQHHADEEFHVFPRLLGGSNAELVQHVRRLQQDHGWLEEDWMEIELQLKAVAEGYSWYDVDTLRYGVGVFSDLLREHIALEESLIYPEARRREQSEREARERRGSESDGAAAS